LRPLVQSLGHGPIVGSPWSSSAPPSFERGRVAPPGSLRLVASTWLCGPRPSIRKVGRNDEATTPKGPHHHQSHCMRQGAKRFKPISWSEKILFKLEDRMILSEAPLGYFSMVLCAYYGNYSIGCWYPTSIERCRLLRPNGRCPVLDLTKDETRANIWHNILAGQYMRSGEKILSCCCRWCISFPIDPAWLKGK